VLTVLSCGADDAGNRRLLVQALVAAQEAMKECIHGLLELSFPADEAMAKASFPDPAAVELSMHRLDRAAGCVAALGTMFAAGDGIACRGGLWLFGNLFQASRSSGAHCIFREVCILRLV
jgi:hypothetical protein